jgi:hypothetical protein
MKSGKGKKKIKTFKIEGCKDPRVVIEMYRGVPEKIGLVCGDKSADALVKKLNDRTDLDYEYHNFDLKLQRSTLKSFGFGT